MNYAIPVVLLASLPILFQQAPPDETTQHTCPMQAMTGYMAEKNTATDVAPQSAEQLHHVLLAEERLAMERGEGFGMAFAAERNGYPGPRHALDLQTELNLTPEQVSAMREIFAQMREKALASGKEVLQAEDKLEQMFRDHRPEAELREQALRANTLRGELRWVHLRTHLSAARLLTAEQIALYSRLRHEREHQSQGAGQGGPTPTTHFPQLHSAEEQHHEGVVQRGDEVMGFSHEKTTHHFRLYPDGGAIEAEAKDAKDTASREQIRMHFGHIVTMFAEGNFSAPMLIHAQNPPGTEAMKRLSSAIEYKVESTEKGARIRIITKDAEALRAVHEFLRFQIADHQTGDSTEVTKVP